MIDLHIHSVFSDGSFTPEELVREGRRRGLTAMALTDHDTVDGVPRFLEAGRRENLRTIAGVEISADFHPGTMHILGYFVRPDDAQLNEHLVWIREGRSARNAEILSRLVEHGIRLKTEEIQEIAGGDVIGRPHIAQAMVARGYVESVREAFDRYLARGRPAYAERRRLSPEDSIALIHSAGGAAVLAHPVTLGLNGWDLRRLVRNLRDSGLDGIEAYYSEHTARDVRRYLRLAKDYDLAVSGGSDFHGEAVPGIEMGTGTGKLNVPDDILEELEERRH